MKKTRIFLVAMSLLSCSRLVAGDAVPLPPLVPPIPAMHEGMADLQTAVGSPIQRTESPCRIKLEGLFEEQPDDKDDRDKEQAGIEGDDDAETIFDDNQDGTVPLEEAQESVPDKLSPEKKFLALIRGAIQDYRRQNPSNYALFCAKSNVIKMLKKDLCPRGRRQNFHCNTCNIDFCYWRRDDDRHKGAKKSCTLRRCDYGKQK